MTQAYLQNIPLCVLQTGETPEELRGEFGDYDEMCKRLLGLDPSSIKTYRVLDGELPTDISLYDAFIITGSRFGVYEDHDWIAPLEAKICEIYESKKKLIGICFGHQIIAQALGGKVEKSGKGFGIGAMKYEFGLKSDALSTITLNALHQDQVIELPADAEVIASSEFCPFAGLKYGEQIITLQAHPEFSKSYMDALIAFRSGTTFSEELAQRAFATLDHETDDKQIANVFTEFLVNQRST